MPHAKDCQCPPCRYRRGDDKGHAPRLSIRLETDVRDFLLGHEEGARGVIERLVRQEMERGSSRKSARSTEKMTVDEIQRRSKRLEKQVAALDAALAQNEGTVKTQRTTSPVEQLSDKSRSEVTLRSPGPLDVWAARFTEALRKTRKADALLTHLGLTGSDGRWAIQQLRLGYCSPQAWRADAERAELQRHGMIAPNGRDRLAGCLTVPYFELMGGIGGFFGARLSKKAGEHVVTGRGSGLLLTGSIQPELVLVDGVLDALACFGAGLTSVQALDLLTPGWFPEFVKRGVSAVTLALGDLSRAEAAAAELRRLGIQCFWAPMPADAEERQLVVFSHAATLDRELKRATPLEPSTGKRRR